MNQIAPLSLPVTELSPLETLVQQIMDTLAARPEPEAMDPATSTRERFMELLVLSLANMYGKTPVPVAPFSRAIMRNVTEAMDDNDAGAFTSRADDWIRLEGLVRVQEGQKNYVLNRMAIAVLSTPTAHGTVGEVMEHVLKFYTETGPSPALRRLTRQFGGYFMTRLGRS
jgi:hypothetical protein